MRDFWHALEAATNERQQAMFRLLNHHMKRLAQRVETAVGEALEVVLEPAALHLDPPTAQQFHSDLQDLFDSGAYAGCVCSPGSAHGSLFKACYYPTAFWSRMAQHENVPSVNFKAAKAGKELRNNPAKCQLCVCCMVLGW